MSGIIGKAGTKSGIVGATLLSCDIGTWTPAFFGDSGCAATMNVQKGQFTKIGKLVLAEFEASVSAFSCSGATHCTGLPFKSAKQTASEWVMGGWITYGSGLSVNNGINIQCHIEPNAYHFYFRKWDTSTGTNNLPPGEVSADGSLVGTLVYQTQE
tara:strand:+ start:29 stop:496 length:468 start_codon:yes stop_codon:yes gene_type:complete